ncbi:MAG: CoA-binding protein [Acidobacteria bacterium]|nr:CoA-binding protein [Acidobacteriota bacterium]
MSRALLPLEQVLNPTSVAVVGASETPGKIGYQILKNCLDQGYKGKVYPVNPGATEIFGLKAYPSVKDLPGTIDLVAIVIPNQAIPAVLQDCGTKGVKGAIVYAGGFAESGPEGAELQKKVVETARANGIRIFGPNINGLYNASIKLNLSFNQFQPLGGPASVVSQSGSFSSAIVFQSIRQGFGFSKFISLGNKADVNEVDALTYLAGDEDTKAIALYIEALDDEEKFIEVARQLRRVKPIVAVKGGYTEAGIRTIRMTTGSEPGRDPTLREVFHKAGVLQAEGTTDLVDALAALISQPPLRGGRIAICTNAGGPACICADHCEKSRLHIPMLSAETQQKLRNVIPRFGASANPVDLTGSVTLEMYREVVNILLRDDAIDGIICCAIRSIFTPVTVYTDPWIEAKRLAQQLGKPLLACMMGDAEIFKAREILNQHGVPLYFTPERAAQAMSKLYEYYKK